MTEFELIASLTEGAPRLAPELKCGVGDDCAVIAGPAGRDWLVTADALVEGVHFRREWTDLRTLGRKSIAVNLSDIAAMGGTPRFYIVCIAIPDGVGPNGAMELYAGMRERACQYGAALIGGDTSSSHSGLFISITVIGEVESGRALQRSGARAGDAIYVTGAFGGAAMGLECLKASRRDAASAHFVQRHLDPVPRLDAGEALLRSGMVSGMIDASDGLYADLSHIAEASGAGFEIEERLVPREPGFDALARELKADPMSLLLGGGEEYELIFTVKSASAREFEDDVKPGLPIQVSRVGAIVADKGSRVVRAGDGTQLAVRNLGFDHFTHKG